MNRRALAPISRENRGERPAADESYASQAFLTWVTESM